MIEFREIIAESRNFRVFIEFDFPYIAQDFEPVWRVDNRNFAKKFFGYFFAFCSSFSGFNFCVVCKISLERSLVIFAFTRTEYKAENI